MVQFVTIKLSFVIRSFKQNNSTMLFILLWWFEDAGPPDGDSKMRPKILSLGLPPGEKLVMYS